MPDRSALRQKMFSLIEDWNQSGLSQKAFCEQVGIPLHRFHYWRRTYRKQSISSPTGFVELQVEPPTNPAMEIHFPNGVRIILNSSVSSHFLKSLIS